MTRVRRPLWIVASLLAAGGCLLGAPRGRYHMVVDPASRYGFAHVQDRTTGLWVVRECEVRVRQDRPLPNPLSDSEHGDQLHSTRFTPETAQTGSMSPTKYSIQDGYRIWRFRDLAEETSLQGHDAFGVQIEWRKPSGPSDWDDMEIFTLPPFGTLPPEVWSEWTQGTIRRDGAFAWWDEVHGNEPSARPDVRYPFELRWRLLLSDHLYID